MTTIDYAALLKLAQGQAAAAPASAPVTTPTPGTIAPAPPIPAAVAQAYAGDNPFAGSENAEVNEYGKPPLPRAVVRDPNRDPKCNIVSAQDATYDLVLKKCDRKTSRKGITYIKAHFTIFDGNGDSEIGSDVEVTWFRNSDYFDKEVKSFAMGLLNLHKGDRPAIAKGLLDLIHPQNPLAGKIVRIRVMHSKAKKEPYNDFLRFSWIPVDFKGQDPQTGKPIIQLAQDNRGL